MELDYIVVTNVLNDNIEAKLNMEEFLNWLRSFGIVAEKVTKKVLDELSKNVEEIEFSEDHRVLYVRYEDEDEAIEYAEESRGEYEAECENEREAERYINDESSIW